MFPLRSEDSLKLSEYIKSDFLGSEKVTLHYKIKLRLHTYFILETTSSPVHDNTRVFLQHIHNILKGQMLTRLFGQRQQLRFYSKLVCGRGKGL